MKSKGKINFVNYIVNGQKCYNFGVEKFVYNSDGHHNYNVTVRVKLTQAGAPPQTTELVYYVASGSKTYVGCSAGVTPGSVYTYEVIGESIV